MAPVEGFRWLVPERDDLDFRHLGCRQSLSKACSKLYPSYFLHKYFVLL